MTYNKRGQAAMEFLMTYGWAILAAIIAIGVLAYFGVFNPGRLVGSTGIINAPFNMDAFAIVSDSTSAGCDTAVSSGNFDCIRMELVQNSGSSIDVVTPTITPKSGIGALALGWTCTWSIDPATTAWTSGERRTLECFADVDVAPLGAGLTTAWTSGDTISADVRLTYEIVGSTIGQTSSGSVRGVSQ